MAIHRQIYFHDIEDFQKLSKTKTSLNCIKNPRNLERKLQFSLLASAGFQENRKIIILTILILQKKEKNFKHLGFGRMRNTNQNDERKGL